MFYAHEMANQSKKTSKYSRYDAGSKLWVKGKLIYVYWYRFLVLAELDPTRQVNWRKYPYWGGADTVLNMKFEPWYRTHWKRLFAYRKGEEPMFSPTYPHSVDAVRIYLKFYELQRSGIADYAELGEAFADEEYIRRRRKAIDAGHATNSEDYATSDEARKWEFNACRKSVRKLLTDSQKRRQYRIVRSRVGRYLKRANELLDNVCEGRFP